MNKKKKNITKKIKENDEIVDFDDVFNESDKEKNSSKKDVEKSDDFEVEKKDENECLEITDDENDVKKSDAIKEDNSKKNPKETKEENPRKKKEEMKEESSGKKKEEVKEESSGKKREETEENSEKKKEETEEISEINSKGTKIEENSGKKSEQIKEDNSGKKSDHAKENNLEKKSENIGEEEKKEDSADKKAEEIEDEKNDGKTSDEIKEEKVKTEYNEEKKPEETEDENNKIINSNGKAISQSKRLADVNALEEEVRKKNIEVNQTKKMSSKKITGIVFGCITAILLIVYAVGFVYFSGHFYKDVTINGVTVSGLDALDAKRTLDDFYTDYILTIHTVDKKKDIVIAAKDIAMQIQTKDEYSSCLKNQQAYLWFINMFKMYEFHVVADTSWDENKLQKFYDSCDILKKKNMKKPVNAYVGVKDGKFAIVDEVIGSTLSADKFKKVVENSLSEVIPEIDLMEKGCYALPKVYADDAVLKKDLDAKNEFAKNEIKIKLDDLTLEPGMELYEEVLKKSGSGYIIDDSKVKKYVEKLAKEYDTVATEREFETSFSNKKVNVLGNMFGYELDQELTLDALLKALESGKTTTVEAEFKSKGITLKGDNDIGNSYIEVNLSEQRVVAYKDGKKVAEGDCVSGNESAGHGTCIGLYAIQGKQSPAVLRGEKKPVTKTITKKKKGKKVKVQETTYEYEYESPVTFWMPFNGGIGLHDAAGWRSSYGGSIYRYSGSHGCVNLPYDLAKNLYNTFDVGTPVIVYFWDNENRQ